VRYDNVLRNPPDGLVNWVLFGHPYIRSQVVTAIGAVTGETEGLDWLMGANRVMDVPEVWPDRPGVVVSCDSLPDGVPTNYRKVICEFKPLNYFAERWDFYRPDKGIGTPAVKLVDDPQTLDVWAKSLALISQPGQTVVPASDIQRITENAPKFRHIRTDPEAPASWGTLIQLYKHMALEPGERKFPYNQPAMHTQLGLVRLAVTAMQHDAPSYLVNRLLSGEGIPPSKR
jgi:hypothetical protein